MSRTLHGGEKFNPPKGNVAVSIAGYDYRIAKVASQTWYEVRSGKESIRAPISWVFGTGRTGQTFVITLNGKLYESRVSYYPAIGGLDLTVGAANSSPTNLTGAAGRLMSQSDITECFGCHSSSPGTVRGGTPDSLIPGVSCERCHGSMVGHPQSSAGMRKLKSVSTEEISDLCGECHRTWEQVMLLKLKGINTVRFQPYRLSRSKCYDPADRRISCTACHDPHRPAVLSLTRVDKTCTSCHSDGLRRTCPKATANCASCHMPKYELPGAHAKFSDHMIRVARAGEPIPD
jgi:predicted CXXCH cytochrome family protein